MDGHAALIRCKVHVGSSDRKKSGPSVGAGPPSSVATLSGELGTDVGAVLETTVPETTAASVVAVGLIVVDVVDVVAAVVKTERVVSSVSG